MADLPQIIPGRLILFGATLAQWTVNNVVIPQREIVAEIGTGSPATIKLKIGDGTSLYLDLPYVFTGGSGGTGTLQEVLNTGHIANTTGGNIAEIKLISPVATQSIDITGGAVTFFNTAGGASGDFEINSLTFNDGTGLQSVFDNLSLLLANNAGETVAQLVNDSDKGKLLLKTISINKRSTLSATSTNDEDFLLPDKGGAGGTVAMVSDLAGYTPLSSVNSQSGTSYTLVAGDKGKVIAFSNGSAITLTIPTGLGATFSCTIQQNGAGIITPTASGTTLHIAHSFTRSGGQYTMFSIIFTPTTDTYVLQGDMQA